jgi:hypothetical protein
MVDLQSLYSLCLDAIRDARRAERERCIMALRDSPMSPIPGVNRGIAMAMSILYALPDD